ncbi:Uncharacterized protein GBIM_17763, partial [Gryllus bimaculatus]
RPPAPRRRRRQGAVIARARRSGPPAPARVAPQHTHRARGLSSARGDCQPLAGGGASPPPSPAPVWQRPVPLRQRTRELLRPALSLSPGRRPRGRGRAQRRQVAPASHCALRKRHPAELRLQEGEGRCKRRRWRGGPRPDGPARRRRRVRPSTKSARSEAVRDKDTGAAARRRAQRARRRGRGGRGGLRRRARDRAEPPTSATATASTDSSNFSAAWEAANSVLEARRRKFESSVPIESSNKRIRLKKPPLAEPGCGRLEEEDRNRAPSQPAAAAEPLLMATDDLEEILDLELENAMQLWSDDESNSDNEARFKSTEKVAAPTEIPRIRVVPLAKLQGLDSGTKEKPEKGKSRPVSGDEQEHSLHTSVRDVSRKSSRSSRGQEQLSLKEDTLEAQICPPSDALELDQKRSKIRVAAADNLDDLEETGDGSKDGDLRAELSRRRAERLTMAGSVHETLPARLVQSAFKDAVGKKNFRRLDRERHGSSKRPDSQKGTEAGDGRRVLVLKSSAVEQQIPSISVTIPKEEKHKRGGSPVSGGKVPIRMRLGLPGGGSSFPEERERPSGGRRRSSRKVKLKRNVLLASPAGEKV